MNEEVIYANILNITIAIYNLYSKLALLEFENKTNTLEYEKTLRLIEFYSTLEESFYSGLDYSTLIGLVRKSTSEINKKENKKKNSLYKPVDYLFSNMSHDSVMNMRISSIAYGLLRNRIDIPEEELYTQNVIIPLRNKIFIKFLDEQISDPEYSKVRSQLIVSKYCFSFIYPKDANDLKMLDKFTRNCVVDEAVKEIMKIANKLSFKSESDLLDPVLFKKIVVLSNYIRANAFVLKPSEIEDVKKRIINLSKSGKFGDANGLQLIFNLLDYSEEDKINNYNIELSFKRKF